MAGVYYPKALSPAAPDDCLCDFVKQTMTG